MNYSVRDCPHCGNVATHAVRLSSVGEPKVIETVSCSICPASMRLMPGAHG
jgi:hypothetical protein